MIGINIMISATYRFSQDCPVLFTFSLQGAMALLSLLQFLQQLLKQTKHIQKFFCQVNSNQYTVRV